MPGSTVNWLSVKNSRYKTEVIEARTICIVCFLLLSFLKVCT